MKPRDNEKQTKCYILKLKVQKILVFTRHYVKVDGEAYYHYVVCLLRLVM